MNPKFRDDLARAIDIARWAPSSHNSQPWVCLALSDAELQTAGCDASGLDDRTVCFGLHQDRILTGLPYHHTEMLVSLGCFSQLVVKLLFFLGWRVDTSESLAGKTLSCDEGGYHLHLLCQFTEIDQLATDAQEQFNRLKTLIMTRKTQRSSFDTAHGVQPHRIVDIPYHEASLYQRRQFSIKIVNDHEQVEGVRRLIRSYGDLDFKHYQAWKETYSYIGFGKTSPKVGFSSETLFGQQSVLTRFVQRIVFSPVMMQCLRVLKFPRVIADGMAAMIPDDSACITMSYRDNERTDQSDFEAGCQIIDMLLHLTSLSLSCHPVSILLQHDWLNDMLQSVIKENGSVIFIARIGVPSEHFPVSDRLDSRDIFLIKDQPVGG